MYSKVYTPVLKSKPSPKQSSWNKLIYESPKTAGTNTLLSRTSKLSAKITGNSILIYKQNQLKDKKEPKNHWERLEAKAKIDLIGEPKNWQEDQQIKFLENFLKETEPEIPLHDITQHNQKDREYNGLMSRQTRAKVKKYINHWLDAYLVGSGDKRKIDKYLKFVTLTLPSKQMHDDNELKRAFGERFIKNIKYRYGVKNYLWRAEAQVNGNIHFHVLIDQYIEWEEIRKIWNQNVLEPLGYIEAYQKKMQNFHRNGFQINKHLESKGWTKEAQFKAYEKGMAENWRNPNSTDIHSLNKVKNISSYITKYMTKCDKVRKMNDVRMESGEKQLSYKEELRIEHDERKILGRIWGCSDTLRNCNDIIIEVNDELLDYVDYLVKEKEANNIEKEHCRVIFLDNHKHLKRLPHLYNYFIHVHTTNYYKLYGEIPKNAPETMGVEYHSFKEYLIELEHFSHYN